MFPTFDRANRTVPIRFIALVLVLALITLANASPASPGQAGDRQRLLYVASPGVRNYVEWGGHGVLVFDIDHGHRFVKRISLEGYGADDKGNVLNVKGVCASAARGRLYVSTLRQLICIDLLSER
jgi:hypothetical protein